jgi:hypothetical protein
MNAAGELRHVLSCGNFAGIAGNGQRPVIYCDVPQVESTLRREKHDRTGDARERYESRNDESRPLPEFFQDFLGPDKKRRAI